MSLVSVTKMKLSDILLGAILATVVVVVSNTGAVDAAEALYVLGDSYMDTGNEWVMKSPYGSTWPGVLDNRYSDGRNQADYFAELFGLPSPTPFRLLQNNSIPLKGVNFAHSGAGVTYAWGIPTLDQQVDDMEVVTTGKFGKAHFRKSVAVLNIGVNDYDTRNLKTPFQETWTTNELVTFVTTVVDGIAMAIVRLHAFGVRHIIVTNVPMMACIPLCTHELAFTACSTNSSIVNQTELHNSLLQKRVQGLNQQLRGVHVVIADQTKAFQELFTNGAKYGFVKPLVPCCHGNGTNLYNVVCGNIDNEGRPLYKECKDPSKAVLFDTIHPTQAAWKTIINLYAYVPGFTLEGPKLHTWIRKYNV